MQLGLQLPDGLIEIQPEVIVNEYHSEESARRRGNDLCRLDDGVSRKPSPPPAAF